MEKNKPNVVPWFSAEEWDYVCKLVYSNDVKDQTKGYEQLLVWRARVPSLPASVTCTLELLQVHLWDQVLCPKIACGEAPPYAEQELRLSYSTVIMRFLNHLASLFQNTRTQTLYSVAKKLNIPAWMVNLRHDAAHGGSLPSVDILRSAAGYALSWLHEYWWKPEAISLLDWKVTEVDDDDHSLELCNLLDLWQALNLYQEINYNSLDQIPDEEVRTQVSILYSKMKGNSCNESRPDSDLEVAVDFTCTQGTSIREASSLVLLDIKKFLGKFVSLSEWDQILLDNLVGEGIFQPSFLSDEDWLHVENNELPRRSLKIWEPVLACLPIAVLLRLMQKLLKLTCTVNGSVSNQSRLASLWIRELSVAIIKINKVLDLVEEVNAAANSDTESKTVKLAQGISVSLEADDKLAKLTPKKLRKKLVGRVESECPELRDVLLLSVAAVPDKKEMYEVLRFAVLNPNQLTPIFLPSLLTLVDLPASGNTHHNLMSLVELYTQFRNTDAEMDADAPVFTVADLMSSTDVPEEHSAQEISDPISKYSDIGMDVEERDHNHQLNYSTPQQNVSESHWQLAEANLQWNMFPLGILPWQEDESWLDLTSHESTWHLSEEMGIVSSVNKLPQLFLKAIEWEDVKKRRLKKKVNPPISRKIVQTVFETLSLNNV